MAKPTKKRERLRGTENVALKNVWTLAHSSKNNVQNKKKVIFHIVEDEKPQADDMHTGKYHISLPDGWKIRIIRKTLVIAGVEVMRWHAYYEKPKHLKVLSASDKKRLEINVLNGYNVKKALADLLGHPIFWNNDMNAWMSYYNLCEPWFALAHEKKTPPTRNVSNVIPTQATVNSLQKDRKNVHQSLAQRESYLALQSNEQNKQQKTAKTANAQSSGLPYTAKYLTTVKIDQTHTIDLFDTGTHIIGWYPKTKETMLPSFKRMLLKATQAKDKEHTIVFKIINNVPGYLISIAK